MKAIKNSDEKLSGEKLSGRRTSILRFPTIVLARGPDLNLAADADISTEEEITQHQENFIFDATRSYDNIKID